MELKIREFNKSDCEKVSAIIRENLIKVNIKDYPEKIIASMYERFTPAYINLISKSRNLFVAVCNNEVVGTASLDDDKIYTVFVDMKYHGQGVGKKLIEHIEDAAKNNGVEALQLPASLTAVGFYKKLGYYAVEEAESEANGKNVVMEKKLI